MRILGLFMVTINLFLTPVVYSNETYTFLEQREKGYIWNSEKFIYVDVIKDLINTYFFTDGGDTFSFELLKLIEKDDKDLAKGIHDIQKSYVACKVSQHIGTSEITAYIGDTLIYIDGNGTSFNSVADDQYVGLHLVKDSGTYQYITILGATNTISKYKVLDIKKEKRQLLDYYLYTAYLQGIRQDIKNGYVDISYCKDCSACNGTSFVNCPDCCGSGKIENYKVISEKELNAEIQEEVVKKIQVYKKRFEIKKQRLGNSTGDIKALQKEKLLLENREKRIHEMVTEQIRNKKVKCPYCCNGKVLCSKHSYETVNYKPEFSYICDERKNKD